MGLSDWLRAFGRRRGAHAEGLAAGTGLLTGEAAARAAREGHLDSERCARCDAPAEVALVDLVVHQAQCVCTVCGQTWVVTAERTAGR